MKTMKIGKMVIKTEPVFFLRNPDSTVIGVYRDYNSAEIAKNAFNVQLPDLYISPEELKTIIDED